MKMREFKDLTDATKLESPQDAPTGSIDTDFVVTVIGEIPHVSSTKCFERRLPAEPIFVVDEDADVDTIAGQLGLSQARWLALRRPHGTWAIAERSVFENMMKRAGITVVSPLPGVYDTYTCRKNHKTPAAKVIVRRGIPYCPTDGCGEVTYPPRRP